MNRKALVPAIILPLAVAFALVVGVIAFLSSVEIRYTLIGVALIGGTLIFVIPAAFKGDFTREKMIFSILLIMVGVVVVFAPKLGLFEQAIGGFSALSVDDITIDGQEKIRIYGTAVGAEGLNIEVSADQINEYISDDGYEATNGVNGYIELVKQEKQFRITSENDENIFLLFPAYEGLELRCTLDDCNSLPALTPHAALRSGLFGCTCLYKQARGTLGSFSGVETEYFEATFDLLGETKTVSNDELVVHFDNGATVEWTGNLNSLHNEVAPNYKALFHESEWQRLVRIDTWALFQQEYADLGTCINVENPSAWNLFTPGSVDIVAPGYDAIEECVEGTNGFNDEVMNEVLTDKTDEYQGALEDRVNNFLEDIYFQGDNLVVNLDDAASFPTFTITLDASHVGIVSLSGEPNIVSCQVDETIDSGSSFTAKVNVRNAADTPGSFIANIDCNNENVFEDVEESYFSAGESKEMTVRVGGVNLDQSKDLSAECKVTVKDRKSPENHDICYFDLNIKYKSGQLCEPGTTECVTAGILQTCDENGIPSYTPCPNGCVNLDDQTAQCVEETGDGGAAGDVTCTPFIEKLVVREGSDSGFLGWRKLFGMEKKYVETKCVVNPSFIWILIGVVFTIVIIALVGSTKPGFKKKKKKVGK